MIVKARTELTIISTDNTLTQMPLCAEAARRCSLNKEVIQATVTSHRKDLSVNAEACRSFLSASARYGLNRFRGFGSCNFHLQSTSPASGVVTRAGGRIRMVGRFLLFKHVQKLKIL